MKKTLTDLYFGKLDGLGLAVNEIPGYREVQSKASRIGKKISKHLDKEGQALFFQYSDLQVEMEVLMSQADFIHGFCMGARLMAEVFGKMPETEEAP